MLDGEASDHARSDCRRSAADRQTAPAAWVQARGGDREAITIQNEKTAAIGALVRERLTKGETPFRKARLGSIIDRIEVDQGTIRIWRRKDELEQPVASSGAITLGVRT
jgi:hypothetical protein